MTCRPTLWVTCCLAMLFADSVLFGQVTSPSRAVRPNIVLILADDLGYGDLGCYGQAVTRTPHLDRMAAEGMRFTRCYAGNAVCAPSRCVLMTGMHPGHAIVRNNKETVPGEGQFPLPAGTVTLARLLQSQGYATGGYGKWGLGGPDSTGEPLQQGFDHFFGYLCQRHAHNFYPTYLWDDHQRFPLRNPEFASQQKLPPDRDPHDPASYRSYSGPDYSADRIAERALEFVRQNRERPFFLYWPTTVPHVALQVPEDSADEYAGQFDDPPYRGEKGYLPHRRPRAAYAGMITRMDREIGRLMSLLKELRLDENTIVLFSSDNGGLHEGIPLIDWEFFNSTGGLRGGKGYLTEGGIRVPLIVRWPGTIVQGAVSDRIVGFEDFLPTLLDLSGLSATLPEKRDGISFAPTLRSGPQAERPFLYREFAGYGGWQSVHIGEWKGLRSNLQPPGKKAADLTVRLYHLPTDPGETRDRAAEFPEIRKAMKQVMRAEHVRSADFPIRGLDE